ncbi:MAG: CpsD/CapB family tyrosine-protein kinase [Fusobacteriaceae bacterium]
MEKTHNSRKLFFKGESEDQIAESFRLLRTNIHFLDEKKNRVIIVTSTIPKEGKSSVASNYAMAEAIGGNRVLLIDSDIRRPRAHTSFGIQVEKGLSDVLLGTAELKDVIMKDVEKNLDIIPANYFRGNVTEMFLSKNLSKYIDELRGLYDLIVIDTPPLTVATDALLLAEHGDGIIYVVAYDMVTKRELEHSRKLIDRSGVKIYGIVMNKVDKSGYSYGNYGYYNYNYHYYNEYMQEK